MIRFTGREWKIRPKLPARPVRRPAPLGCLTVLLHGRFRRVMNIANDKLVFDRGVSAVPVSVAHSPPAEIHIYLHGRWKRGGNAGLGIVVLGRQLLPTYFCKSEQVGNAGTSHAAFLAAWKYLFEILMEFNFWQSESIMKIWISDHTTLKVLTHGQRLALEDSPLRERQEDNYSVFRARFRNVA